MDPGLKLNVAQRQTLEAIAEQMGRLRLSTDYRVSFPAASASAWRWRAAVRKQPLLLLDEPFSALDPALRQEMLSLVEEVCEREN